MADDRVAAAVKDTPLAYLTPENQAAQKSLTLLGNRNANLPNLVQNNHQLPRSSHTAKAKYRFSLSFGHPGKGRNGTWLLGKGDAKRSVDLQLCPPKSSHLIGPVLCTISIHPQSGAFVLQNKSQLHSIKYLEADIVLGYQESHILFMTRNHLYFGPLSYVFEFNTENEADFSLARMKYIRKYIVDDTTNIDAIYPQLPCHLLDVLPKPTQVRIGDIIVHQTIARGAFGLVRIGVHKRTGHIVACKIIRCWQQNVTSVKNEVDLSSLLPASTDRKDTGPTGKEDGCKTVLERLESLREQGYIPDKLGALLSHMLSWNPIHRPTAAQALDHEAWHGVAAGAGTGAGAMAPEPTSQQDSDVSSEGGAAAAAGGGSGSGTGGREKRMRRSDGPSPDLAPGGSGLGSAARSGAGGSGAKRVRRSDGPSPDTLPGCSGEEE
ncbi:hypothetical protein VM1G_05128 [Cytospora mali]|uniref:Protein kinase domain-containing protein n=1 Tax=Cytospora mali TaxID=578113 RepID=A0A194W1B0_CYTMA|nr:hypothetical protein VM1G_05128 [Valsa mali]